VPLDFGVDHSRVARFADEIKAFQVEPSHVCATVVPVMARASGVEGARRSTEAIVPLFIEIELR
jgi:hypothetical protein